MSADTATRLITSPTRRRSAPPSGCAPRIGATGGGASSAPVRPSPEAGGQTDEQPGPAGNPGRKEDKNEKNN